MTEGVANVAAAAPLPEADAETAASVKDWLERFAACVRALNYAAARPFWHPDVVIFGTYQELVRGLLAWEATQWDKVWPHTEGFAFLLDETVVLASPNTGMATAIAPWTSTGFHPDGTPFDRPGRSTLVLQRQANKGWLGVHSHMSLARGTPQESFGRPVKA